MRVAAVRGGHAARSPEHGEGAGFGGGSRAAEAGDERAAHMLELANRSERGLTVAVLAGAGAVAPALDVAPEAENALLRGEDVVGIDEGAERGVVCAGADAGEAGAIRISETREEEASYIRSTLLRSTLQALAMAMGCAAVVTLLAWRLIAWPLQARW
ncbi:MAG: hypothetical protein R3F14_28090 [Polyangiaceae bacterium]